METIKQINEEFTAFMDSVDLNYSPRELYAPIIYTLFQKGKRLRPMLCLLACDMFGGNRKDALYPALGLETFHNMTLIHDDIMDDAPIRRGMPTVYKKWDTNTAILSGDAMFYLSLDFAMRTPNSLGAVRLMNQGYREVCEGQQYDMNFETCDEVSIDEYLNMIRLKTAVLLAISLRMGALIGGASEADQKNIYDFGIAIGIAFQLQDDLLDCYCDEAVFGKKMGGDILENKKTYMYLKALELASPDERQTLRSLYSSACALEPDEKIRSVKAIYDKLHVKECVEQMVKDYYRQADDFLDAVAVPADCKKPLREYAWQLLGRNK